MRIVYIGRWSTEPGDGVRTKVEAQADEWRRRGHDVVLFRLPVLGYGADSRRQVTSAASHLASVLATTRLLSAGMRPAHDLAYIRYGLFLPGLQPLQRRIASVVELNGNDRAEALTLRRRRRRALNERARRSLLGGAAGLVCVAHELARSVAELDTPTRVIANGVALDAIPELAPRRSGRPTVAFLAGIQMPWHGVDKLFHLAEALPDWDFDFIGGEPEWPDPHVPANVRVHPRMSRELYAPILAAADVGIGTLALHRAGLDEGSPLKVREYLAHGLPVVIAYEDTDFTGLEPWFALRLPNTEDNVREGIDDIRRFVEGVRGRRVARADIEGRIGWQAKEDARLAFMAEVAEVGSQQRP